MRYSFLSTACLCTLLILPNFSAHAQEQKGYLELNDVLHHVNNDNPTLQAAREELNRTREKYPQARAGWLPSVNTSTEIYKSDVESSNFGNADGATTKDLTLNVNQPIWRGGRTFAETARANDLISAGEALLLQVQQEIYLNAVTSYMNVLRDRELLDIRKKNEDILMKELQAAWSRVDIGSITDTDVQQAKARLSRAKSSRIDAERDLNVSNSIFAEVTGMNPPKKIQLPYTNFNFPSTLDRMIELAEEKNPDIWIIKYEHKASKHNVDAIFRELMPQISAYASYNKQYDPQPGITDDTQVKTFGLRATLALYEGGATRSRVREAKREAKRLEYNIIEIRRRIKQQITSNYHSYKAAQAKTENRKVEIEAAQLALKGVREETKMGQRTVLDILDADQEVIEAQADLARARRDETVAKYSLASSLGLLSEKKD